MPVRLTPIPFTKDDLDTVADFDCGGDPWARYLASWIRGRPNGVLDALDAGTEVWLYLNDQNEIVGFGSLGTTEWHYPNPFPTQSGRGKVKLCLIPAYAVHSGFQGQPPGDWRERYASVILRDLMNEAVQRCRRDPSLEHILGLFVDVRNTRAIAHYERHGFQNFAKPLKTGGVSNQRMLVNLDVPPISAHEQEDRVLEHTTATAGGQEKPDDATQGSVPRPFEQAVSAVLNAPPTPEQQAKKAARKARAEERKEPKKPKHGR